MRTLRATAMPCPSRSPPPTLSSCAVSLRQRWGASATSWTTTATTFATRPACIREAGIYEALLVALDGKPIVPDHNARQVLRDLMDMNDRENEYARAVVEHEAVHDLLDQLTPYEAR